MRVRYTVLFAAALLAGSVLGLAQQARVNGIIFEVGPRGIFPNQVTVPPGRVSITIVNRTGRATIDFQLVDILTARLQGNPKIDATPGKSHRSTSVFVLTPGTYDLAIIGSPTISSKIIVKP